MEAKALIFVVERLVECHFCSFDSGSVRIKGEKTLSVSLREFFVHVTVTSICVWLVKNFVLASRSNLSLATAG